MYFIVMIYNYVKAYLDMIYNYVKAYLDMTYMRLHICEHSDKIIYEYQYNYNLHKKVQLYMKEQNIHNFLYVDDKMNKKWNLYITSFKHKNVKGWLDNNSLINKIHAREKFFTHEHIIVN